MHSNLLKTLPCTIEVCSKTNCWSSGRGKNSGISTRCEYFYTEINLLKWKMASKEILANTETRLT